MINFDKYKDGKDAILTFNYDDGVLEDRRLVEIFNKYGMKATFHINSGSIGDGTKCTAEEIPALYKGHEISCHGQWHLDLTRIPQSLVIKEFTEDKKVLEPLAGAPMRGCSYAFGKYNDDVISALKCCGMEYARTVESTGTFRFPADFMKWHPTCHHNNCLEMADKFFELRETYPRNAKLFYVWGHAYEFQRYGDKWHIIEDFCKKMQNIPYIWYATNIEIKEYADAVRSLKISYDESAAYNPTATDVWITKDGETVKIPKGELVKL